MTEALWVILAAALLHNLVLTQGLGLHAAVVPVPPREALRSGLGLMAILLPATALTAMLRQSLLGPARLDTLLLPTALGGLLLSALALTALLRHPAAAPWHSRLALPPLPTVAAHSLLLGTVIFGSADGIAPAVLHALGAGLGFTLALLAFASLASRLDTPAVPAAFRGVPLQLLSAGILALALAGFAGLGA